MNVFTNLTTLLRSQSIIPTFGPGSLPGDPFFIDYLLVDELIPAEPDFELELEFDPEYQQFLHDLAEQEYMEAIQG